MLIRAIYDPCVGAVELLANLDTGHIIYLAVPAEVTRPHQSFKTRIVGS